MKVKEFEKGATAYILDCGYRSKGDVIECKIESVGRKYVVAKPMSRLYAKKFVENECYDKALSEVEEYGYADLLFKTKKDVEKFQELQNLRRWLSSTLSDHRRQWALSLEQLKAIKAIVEGGVEIEKVESHD